MLNNLLDILKIAGVYTAIVFGAGIASGQEVLNFFVKYGAGAFYGAILSGIIFCIIGYAVLDITEKKRITTATIFLKTVFKKFSIVIESAVAIFLFVIYSTMLSACGETFQQELNKPKIYGVIVMAVLCYITYMLGKSFFAKLNLIITPILLFGTTLVSLYIILNNNTTNNVVAVSNNWFKGGCLYAAYNIITAISVIVPMITTVKNEKNAKYGAILGGVFLTIIAFVLILALSINYKIAIQNQVPMLAIVDTLNNNFIKIFYTIVFMLAMFTTAIGNFFALCEWLHKKNLKYVKIIVNILALLFAQIHFSNFVDTIFPVFGYIGLIEIIIIAVYYFNFNDSK
jgi:uncharacterized membrane protein YkvI